MFLANRRTPHVFFGGISVAPFRMAFALKELGHEVYLNGKLRGEEYDVISVHYPLYIPYASLLKGSAIVVSHAHMVPQDLRGGVLGYRFLRHYATREIRRLYQQSGSIVTVSEFAEACLRKIRVDVPTLTIANGIPLWRFPRRDEQSHHAAREDLIKRARLDPAKPIMGGVGTLFPRKGILDFKRMAVKNPGFEFVWVGTSVPSYPFLFFRRYLGRIPRNLHFLGYYPDIVSFYHALDVYLMTSHIETYGITVAEAAATKTPMIVRNLPVFDWLDDGKDALKADSIMDFNSGISEFLNGGIKPGRMTDSAFDKVSLLHDIRRTSRALEGYYSSLLDEV